MRQAGASGVARDIVRRLQIFAKRRVGQERREGYRPKSIGGLHEHLTAVHRLRQKIPAMHAVHRNTPRQDCSTHVDRG